MGNLLTLLLILFATLAVTVLILEKWGKPMSAEQQNKLSSTAMMLMAILLIALLLRQIF